MFVQTYSYDNAAVLITIKRLTGCSLVISSAIDTKTSHMHAHPSSIRLGKGCDGYNRGREDSTTGLLDFDFSISTLVQAANTDGVDLASRYNLGL